MYTYVHMYIIILRSCPGPSVHTFACICIYYLNHLSGYTYVYKCIYVHVYYCNNFTDLVDIDKLTDENVISAYSYLLYKLSDLFAGEDFTTFKRVCMQRGTQLSQEYKQKIKAAEKLDDIFDVLDDPLYCNWLNVSLLKRIAKNIGNQPAKEIIQLYEDIVNSRKVSDVKKHFPLCFDKNLMTKISEDEKILEYENRSVKEFTKYLESRMDVDITKVSLTGKYICSNLCIYNMLLINQ